LQVATALVVFKTQLLSGAVSINADGTATTLAQLQTLGLLQSLLLQMEI